MESEFDNIKEVDYYNSRNFYPSDENTTSNEHSMDPKQLLWSVNDNHNNIINEGDSKQTTTTITTTTTTSSNGQFDDNLLYSSDNLDVNQKIPSPGSEDNNLHHASTLENNGEEFLAAGFDNKNEFPAEFDEQKIIEKTDAMQHLGEVEADYGPETCVDVTDDVVMMTENSADTNNLLEQSALSHSKDTLPSSDNCNPFDNKNTLDLEDGNDFPLGSGGGVDVNQQLEDANKATPLLSPEVEDLPLSSEGGLQYTNEGFQHSPLDDEIPVGIGGGLHQQEVEFEHEFVQSNGHLSPVDAAKEKVEQAMQQEDIESLAKLERFGDLEDKSPLVEDGLKTDLDEDITAEPLEVQEKQNPFENVEDENDFRLKDEEELLEKHVDVSFAEQDLERLDLSHRDDLHQTLQNLEGDVLEEKPILTGHFEPSFDDLSTEPEVEKPSEFAEEKQDREEFPEKEDREEKLTFVEQKSAPSEDIELEEEDCIHLEEDVRPSDYLAMLERQKEEHQKLSEVVEGYEGFERVEIGKLELGDHHEPATDNFKYEEDDRLSDKVEQLAKEQEFEQLNEEPEQTVEQVQFEKEQLQHEADDRLDEQVEEIEKHEHYDVDENVSFGAEQREQERHLDDIEIMSQQFDRFEKEDQAEDRLNDHLQLPVNEDERLRELDRSQEDIARLCEQMDALRQEEVEHYQNKEETVGDDLTAQPEKQCFEEPEKLVEDDLQVVNELVLQQDEPIAESEHHDSEPEDSFEENEKQLVECTEKQLEKIEMQVLNSAAELAKSDGNEVKLFDDIPENPEELVEVVEDIIVKECVKSKLPVSSQDPAAVPPTHESCDESEDDEWKYMKEGQGEKQLLGLQGDTVVEEEIQQHLESGAFSVDEKPPTSELIEQVSEVLANQIETIQESFENLTQNIAELAESAATLKDDTVNQLASNIDSLNLSQSSTREKLDNIDDEDLSASEMNSKLNPEAKEFVPTFTPPGAVDLSNGFGVPTAIPPHFKDDVLAQSPRKGRESNMELINIPAENEFDNEIALKPHGLPGDEAITEPQEMNWKESMHGYEKEEGPLIDSPVTEESLEVVDNALQGNLLDISAPLGLDNAGMKESIYIEHDTTGEEDILNTVQMLPTDSDSKDTSFEVVESANENIINLAAEIVPVDDIVTKEDVQEILTLTSDNKPDDQIEQKMEQLLLNHDNNIIKDVQLEVGQIPINGVEMSPTTPAEAVVIEQAEIALEQTPSAPAAEEVLEALSLGAAAAVAVAATTAAVKKVEAEKNQKNLSKTSLATKSKVPDAKKSISKTSSAAPLPAKRTSTEKPKPAATSTLAAKKTIGSTTTAAAPRPRTAPVAGAVKTAADKKTTTTTTSTTARSRIDSKPPSTLTARRPLMSSASKTTASKPGDDGKPSSTTLKSVSSSRSTLPAKSSVSSTRTTLTTNSIGKARPATASSVATTNGTATKTAATKPTTLAPKSAGHIKPTLTSPRGTLTSTLRKTEAIKSPTKTTSSTITSRVNSGTTNGTKTTTTTRTTTLKNTVPTVASRSTTTTTTTTATRRTTSAVGATTPTTKTTNLVPRKSTPLKKTTTSSSSTPTARKSIGSKLNASATKPTKDTTTPRPVTIPAHLQNNNNSIVSEEPPKELVPNATSTPPAADQGVTTNGEPKLNGTASPDDVSTSPTAPTAPAHPLEVAEMA